MTSPNPNRYAVDPADTADLAAAYRSLIKAGNDSVRAAWRFGQCIDSKTDAYTRQQIADAIGVHPSTVARYLRLYHAYQRPELAVQASELLETFNIDLVTQMRDDLRPAVRPMAGRHYRYRCQHCHSLEVKRIEVDDDGQPVEPEEPEAGRGNVVPVRFAPPAGQQALRKGGLRT